jgi:hypothetical protein
METDVVPVDGVYSTWERKLCRGLDIVCRAFDIFERSLMWNVCHDGSINVDHSERGCTELSPTRMVCGEEESAG